MKKNEIYYGAYSLYILRPSKIIDVEGNYSIVKSALLTNEVEVVEQDITFRTIPNQIVIARQSTHDKHCYISMFEENSAKEYNHYFDQLAIEKKGLLKSDEKAGFIGLFPHDIISLEDLPDFKFMQKLGKINPIKKLKYFNHKKQLKSKYHQKLEKIQYTIEELKELKEQLSEIFPQEEQTKIITKSYTIAKKINQPHLHLDAQISSGEIYSGI